MNSVIFRTSLRAIIAAVALGILAAVLMVSLALQHNPQQVFQTAAGIEWLRLLPLMFIGFVLGSGSALSLYFCANLIKWIVRRR